MRTKRQNPGSEADGKWLDVEKQNLDSGRGRSFFLTSLLIELIEGPFCPFCCPILDSRQIKFRLCHIRAKYSIG